MQEIHLVGINHKTSRVSDRERFIVDDSNLIYLNDFLISKYGTVAAAQAKILHYKHNTKGTIITKETKDLASTFQTSYSASNYSPVYAYDYEDELNEAKRNIKLIDAGLANQAKQLLREIMTG